MDKDKADRKDVSHLTDFVNSHSVRLNGVAEMMRETVDVTTGLEEEVRQLNVNVVTKGELGRVGGNMATTRMLADAVARIKAELDAKGWSKDVENLKRMVRGVKEEGERTRRKANLAGNFVEWYGRKGEVLEGNLNAVDRHLEKLAVKAKVKGEI